MKYWKYTSLKPNLAGETSPSPSPIFRIDVEPQSRLPSFQVPTERCLRWLSNTIIKLGISILTHELGTTLLYQFLLTDCKVVVSVGPMYSKMENMDPLDY